MYHGVGCKIGNSPVVFSLNSLVAKTLACRAGDPGSIPGWGVSYFVVYGSIGWGVLQKD